MLTRRKAISNAVSAILLVMIAVIAVALIWTAYSQFFVPNVDVKLLSVSMRDIDGDGYLDHFEITIKNTGNVPLRFDTSKGIEYSGVDLYNLDDSKWCRGEINAPLQISPNEKVTIVINSNNDEDFNLERGEWLMIYLYFVFQNNNITKTFKVRA